MAYTYLPSSVSKFPPPEELAVWMESAGFADVAFKLVEFRKRGIAYRKQIEAGRLDSAIRVAPHSAGAASGAPTDENPVHPSTAMRMEHCHRGLGHRQECLCYWRLAIAELVL